MSSLVSFDNTEVAFQHLSDAELRRAIRLFRLLAHPGLVRAGKLMTSIAFGMHLPVKGLIKRTVFRHFCGGEDLEECDARIADLAAHGVGSILDYSVEASTDPAGFDATAQEIIATADKADNDARIPFCVFKISGISSTDLLFELSDPRRQRESTASDHEALVNRLTAICEAASRAGTPIMIDAEESWIQPAIDSLARAMMARFNARRPLVFNTLQMYRHDRLAVLDEAIQRARTGGYRIGIKLVRGAYMEKERERAEKLGYPSPIQPDKERCDRDFNAAISHIIDNLDVCSLCVATHNETSIAHTLARMKEAGIAADDRRLSFAQLLGMSDNLSFNLARAGHAVAKYVPYGPVAVTLPYLFRRAEENTSVAGQTGRELELLRRERERRTEQRR